MISLSFCVIARKRYKKVVAKLCMLSGRCSAAQFNLLLRAHCRAKKSPARKIKDLCCRFVGALSLYLFLAAAAVLFTQRFDKAIQIILSPYIC